MTNPGENPITDIWMTIPTLSRARIGGTYLDRLTGKIAMNQNQVVVGNGSNVFSLADIVKLGIKTQYEVPLMIETTKKICLDSSGDALNTRRVCTTFGDAASGISTIKVWQNPITRQEYVVIGNGDFQYQQTVG